MNNLNVCVILPAAGIGERMDIGIEKQFYEVLGRPIISYTITLFEKMENILSIIVVVSKSKLILMEEILTKFHNKGKVFITVGSYTRHRSIKNAVNKVDEVCSKADIVLIHDGVRPLLEEEDIIKVSQAAYQYGVLGLVRPLVSTILKKDADSFMLNALDRSVHVASEMPQAFRYDIIKKAYDMCSEFDLDHGTECLLLAQNYAKSEVKLIEGPSYLYKITYFKDYQIFENDLRVKNIGNCIDIISEEDINASLDKLIKSSFNIAMPSKKLNFHLLHNFQAIYSQKSSCIIFFPRDDTVEMFSINIKSLLNTLGNNTSSEKKTLSVVIFNWKNDHDIFNSILVIKSIGKELQNMNNLLCLNAIIQMNSESRNNMTLLSLSLTKLHQLDHCQINII